MICGESYNFGIALDKLCKREYNDNIEWYTVRIKCTEKGSGKEKMIMKYTKKGFTLIELIVVICIIGILATILVPSAIGFVRKSKRTSDIGTARNIYNDGGIILAEGGDGFFSYISSGGGGTSVSVERGDEKESYDLQIVCERKANDTGEKWKSESSQFDDFVKELNNIEDAVITLKYFNPTGNERLSKWIVGRRTDDTAKVEVWSADESGNPCFRVWPETDSRYNIK